MALHRWPTDPSGKAPSHSISWEDHQRNLAAQGQGPLPTLGNAPFASSIARPGGAASAPGSAGPLPTLGNAPFATSIGRPGGVLGTSSVAAGSSGASSSGSPEPTSAPPPDPTFEAYKLAAGRNIALSDAESKYQFGRLGNEYGIGDTSNPYSKSALLQEYYNRSKLGTTNSMAARGQLYSGAYGRAQNENDRNYSIQNDALQRAFESAKHGILAGQAQTYATNAIGVDDSRFQALLTALGR